MAIEITEAYQKKIDEALELAGAGKEERDIEAMLKLPLPALIDAAFEQKKKVEAANKIATKTEETFKAIEWCILKLMEDLGDTIEGTDGEEQNVPLLKAGGLSANVTVTESDQPNVKDWDKFYEYIIENNAMHLLQKRATATACRELWEMKEEIAGVEKFVQRKISLRKA